MGIVLKGIELENFKSYANKQYIQFSDLSVLLGANSSGKSTALQALLMLKQTMECNSPDEELLLSGKYVALGDYDDVISDSVTGSFSLAVTLKQTEKSENMLDEDNFKICWNFKRDVDSASAILNYIDVYFENMHLSLKRVSKGLFDLYINDERIVFSVNIHNLLLSNYVVHYDTKLNSKASELINVLSQTLISQKTTTVAMDEPVGINAIREFYIRLLDRLQEKEIDKISLTEDTYNLALRVEKLIDEFVNLELPMYGSANRIIPKDLRIRILELSFANLNSLEQLVNILTVYESYISNYKCSIPATSQLQGSYHLKGNPFWLLDRDDEKRNNLTQLKYALDFYNIFYTDIISKIFFVGPIRETPKGLYNIGFETVPKYVGPTGSYFASVLLHENKKEKIYILPSGKEKCTLSDALAEWMIHLNVASAVDVDRKNSFGFSVSIENMDHIKSDIMNVGIGTSQVLPVLISVLLSEPHEILIFEQPELHLHPYSQSRLADMFVEFCKQGRKIILETHSEYFLLRLRYHIVKNNYSKESAAINFFHNTGRTKVWTTNISGLGNIEYPEDFRDETQELLDSILEAALERKGL
ncbi:MAG: AAA family ATPase [Lachnospiraceae bacterium]|nr:AAA family ATPase [Lachnospiraceae bacterium]MCI9398993.1 AAA family ATPase [Lachnospiraceae bacterium]